MTAGRPVTYTPEQLKQVLRLSAQGLSQRKIAAIMAPAMSKSTIARILLPRK